MSEMITPYESRLRLRVGWGEARPAPGAGGDSPKRRRTLRPDGTADWHMLLIFEGCFLVDPDSDEPTELSPGSVVLYPPFTRQDYMLAEADNYGRDFWAHFFLEGSMPALLDWPATKGGQGLLRWDTGDALHERIHEACTRCDAYYRSDYAGRRSLALLALEEILRLLQQVNPKKPLESVDDRVARSLSFISGNIGKAVTLKAIASNVGLSSSRFSHVFAKSMGCSPMEYVERQRIRMASSMLSETALPVGEIAERAGFSSSFYFSKRFRRVKGVSPTQYRKVAEDPQA